ncbi:hypothetical protein HaLaN_11239 [Haematococcus lacustris]|uniref:Uncharacterized protein n=1 Tax=Haematococcus lacustris TaxID=44745 RepID=A0A699YXS0_HAELA|nr:hypothetical protein HaLaN_11239 [Haematococcus lacustris]
MQQQQPQPPHQGDQGNQAMAPELSVSKQPGHYGRPERFTAAASPPKDVTGRGEAYVPSSEPGYRLPHCWLWPASPTLAAQPPSTPPPAACTTPPPSANGTHPDLLPWADAVWGEAWRQLGRTGGPAGQSQVQEGKSQQCSARGRGVHPLVRLVLVTQPASASPHTAATMSAHPDTTPGPLLQTASGPRPEVPVLLGVDNGAGGRAAGDPDAEIPNAPPWLGSTLDSPVREQGSGQGQWVCQDRLGVWHEALGLRPGSALLVRPDGHVAWRWMAGGDGEGGAVDSSSSGSRVSHEGSSWAAGVLAAVLGSILTGRTE